MASQSKSWIVSVLFTLFGGPGILLFFLPFAVTHFHVAQNLAAVRGIAVALIALGAVPLFDSIVRFVRVGRGTLMPNVPTEELVISGFYRYVRNPMYVGDVVLLAGESLLFASWGLALYTVLVLLGLTLFVVHYEEPTLTQRHGSAYTRYCREVRRWLPRMTPWRG